MQRFLGDGMEKSLCDVTFSPARCLFHFQCLFGFGLSGNVKGAKKKRHQILNPMANNFAGGSKQRAKYAIFLKIHWVYLLRHSTE